MNEILARTLPFFAVIAAGYGAGRLRIFSDEAAAHLTRFVFYFALSALLLRFAANLSLSEVFEPRSLAAYLAGCLCLYLPVLLRERTRSVALPEAALRAHCTISGNTGFLGVPMLVVLLGPTAAGPVLMVLSVDLILFSSLLILLVTGAGAATGGRIAALRVALAGLVSNPMVWSMLLGLLWAAGKQPVPAPVNDFLALLGAAATPGALFAIGVTLAGRAARIGPGALAISFGKLVLHPAAVALFAFWVFGVPGDRAAVLVAAAALPVAGNVYILAQHYRVAPQEVSAAILVSTALSLVSVPLVIALFTGAAG